ncbi:sodium:solute symporter family protein [Alkalimonas sp. MEB108]|uniref:Sodium:solute symporter family protein n=1 Tax=Alkalimonas cellulosilytica TaxID=3058395 RepID=A0ABU7J3B7_9GAMM|nr:sodium:solute symporter family protein [Alkalimonas sp. MEB108]MEE2000515.1 sodium:solute symporter family protein [Alkalimonas sp. MEB108]
MNITAFYLLFSLYIIALIALSLWLSRHQKSGEDFLLAGRNVSTRLSLGTTVATMIGTGTSMGAVGFAYTNSWAGMLYGIGGACGILLAAWLFAPVRRYGFMTMSEELSFYVGAQPQMRLLFALLIFIASLGWLGAHLIGGALYLSWATGLDLDVAKLVIAAAFTVYIVIGGYTAVVWTDSIMAIILFIGFVLMAVLISVQAGGVLALTQQVPAAQSGWQALSHIGLIPAVSLAAVIALGVLATPSFRQRIYSARSVRTVRRAFTLAGLLYLAFAALPAMIGIAARQTAPDLADHQFAFATVAVSVLPAVLAMVVLLAGVSATLSSASSDAIAAVSIFIRDMVQQCYPAGFSQQRLLLLSRLSLVMVALLALAMALMSNDIIRYITSLIATVMSGLAVTALLGRFWRGFRWQGALAAVTLAMTTSLSILLQPDWLQFWGNPVLPAFTCAMVAGVLISLCYQQQRITPLTSMRRLRQERQRFLQQSNVLAKPAESDGKNSGLSAADCRGETSV